MNEPRKAIRVELTFEIDLPVQQWAAYCYGNKVDPADRDLNIWEYLSAWDNKINVENRQLAGYVRYMNLEVSDAEL
jgi:hypothetical protein